MTNQRLFIAIPLIPSVSQSLTEIQSRLSTIRSVRWAKPTHMHLTLQFLGDVPQAKIADLTMVLNEVGACQLSFQVQVASVGTFPNLKLPSIIWAGISDNQNRLNTLQASVIEATTLLGFTPESRPFKAHLTLGRVKKQAKSDDYAQISQTIRRMQDEVDHITTMPVDYICLFRSKLTPAGPVYTSLMQVSLRKK